MAESITLDDVGDVLCQFEAQYLDTEAAAIEILKMAEAAGARVKRG